MVDRQSQLQNRIEDINRKLATGRISKGPNVRVAKQELSRLKRQLQNTRVDPARRQEKELFLTAAQARLTSRTKPQNIRQQREALDTLQKETGIKVTVPIKQAVGNLGFRVQRRKEAKKIRTEIAKEKLLPEFEKILNKTQQNRLDFLLNRAKNDRERVKIINELDRILPESGSLSSDQRKEFDTFFAEEVAKKRKDIISQRGRNLLAKPQKISTTSVYFNKLSQPKFFETLEKVIKRTDRSKIDSRFLPLIDVYSRANKGTQGIIEKIVSGNKGGVLGRGFADILASPVGTAQLINALNEDNLRALGIIAKNGLGKDYFDFVRQVTKRRTSTAKNVVKETIKDPWTYAFIGLGLLPFLTVRVLGRISKFSAKPEVVILTTPQNKIRVGQKIQPNTLILDRQTNKVYVSDSNGVVRLAGKLKNMPLRTKSQLQSALNKTFKALDNQVSRAKIKKESRTSDLAERLQTGILAKNAQRKLVAQSEKLFKEMTTQVAKENKAFKTAQKNYIANLKQIDKNLGKKADRIFNQLTDRIIKENKQIKSNIKNNVFSKKADIIFKRLTDQIISEKQSLKLLKQELRGAKIKEITAPVRKQLKRLQITIEKRIKALEKQIDKFKKQINQITSSINQRVKGKAQLLLKPLRVGLNRLKKQLFIYKQQIRLIKARLSDKRAVSVAKKELKRAGKKAKKKANLDASKLAKKQGFSGVKEKKAYDQAFKAVESRKNKGLPPLKKDVNILNRIEKRLISRSNKKLKKKAKALEKEQKRKAKEKAKNIKKLLANAKKIGVVPKKRRKLRKGKKTARNIRQSEKLARQFATPSQALKQFKKKDSQSYSVETPNKAVVIQPSTGKSFNYVAKITPAGRGSTQTLTKQWVLQRQQQLPKVTNTKPVTTILKTKPKKTKVRKAFTKANSVLKSKSKIRASPAVFLSLGKIFKAINSQKINLTPAQKINLSQNISVMQNIIGKQIPSVKNPSRIIERVAVTPKITQKISELPKIIQRTVLKSKTTTGSKTKKKPAGKPKPIKLPQLPKRKQVFSPNKPYNVYLRQGNKYIKFNPKPLKGSDAKRVLRWAVNNNIAGSGTLRPTKGKTMKIAKRINAPAKYFRKPKKGSRLPPLSLVEKRFFRLNTVGEKRQISLAKLRKQAFGKKTKSIKSRKTKKK